LDIIGDAVINKTGNMRRHYENIENGNPRDVEDAVPYGYGPRMPK
jgi:hypothetical protein